MTAPAQGTSQGAPAQAGGQLDADALETARERLATLQPADLEAATARDTRLYWAHLAQEPRALPAYARWRWATRFGLPALLADPGAQLGPDRDGPEGILQAAARARHDASVRTELVAAAITRAPSPPR